MRFGRIGVGAAVATVVVTLTMASGATAEQVPITCDAFLVEPDGTINPSPIAHDLPGYHTVASAVTPADARPGQQFGVRIPSEGLVLASTAQGLPVVAQNDFVRVFEVTGARVVAGSVSQSPPQGTTMSTTSTTVTLGVSTSVPGGHEMTFPAAEFDVVADDNASTVTVSLARWEGTTRLQNTDGSVLAVRAVCSPDSNLLASTAVQGPPVTRQSLAATGFGDIGMLVLGAGLGSLGAVLLWTARATPLNRSGRRRVRATAAGLALVITTAGCGSSTGATSGASGSEPSGHACPGRGYGTGSIIVNVLDPASGHVCFTLTSELHDVDPLGVVDDVPLTYEIPAPFDQGALVARALADGKERWRIGVSYDGARGRPDLRPVVVQGGVLAVVLRTGTSAPSISPPARCAGRPTTICSGHHPLTTTGCCRAQESSSSGLDRDR
jgi:hypothetical protein